MVKIKVLLENHAVNDRYKAKHGLSIFMEYNGRNILLDVGPDSKFLENANAMGVDLTKIDFLFLSHNHLDHTGGLNDFNKINSSAPIYLMDDIKNRYYAKRSILKIPIAIPIGLKLKKRYHSRVTQLKDDLNIENKIFFLKNTISDNRKPTFNKVLLKKVKGRKINDTFDHEGILVLEDNNELAVFNSCSHNGILNVIESVKRKIPNKKIRSYTGGLHLSNPATNQHESNEYLDNIVEKIKTLNVHIYTGHCTGKFVLQHLKEKLGNLIQEINTGMELNV